MVLRVWKVWTQSVFGEVILGETRCSDTYGNFALYLCWAFAPEVCSFLGREDALLGGHLLPRDFIFPLKKPTPTPEPPIQEHRKEHYMCATLLFPAYSCSVEHFKTAAGLCCRSSTARKREPFSAEAFPLRLGSEYFLAFVSFISWVRWLLLSVMRQRETSWPCWDVKLLWTCRKCRGCELVPDYFFVRWW